MKTFHFSGIGKGLTVTLNVQQYEYLPKFHDSAGIRFLLHADDTVPMVTALGQAAATGTHTYVGVEANKVKIEVLGGIELLVYAWMYK